MQGQRPGLVEDQIVLGPVNLQHGQWSWNSALICTRVSAAGETDNPFEARHLLAGQSVRHEPTVGVSDRKDLIEQCVLAGLLDQCLQVADIVRLCAENVAAFPGPVPELGTIAILCTVRDQQSKSVLIDPAREAEILIGLERVAAVAVQQQDEQSRLRAVYGFRQQQRRRSIASDDNLGLHFGSLALLLLRLRFGSLLRLSRLLCLLLLDAFGVSLFGFLRLNLLLLRFLVDYHAGLLLSIPFLSLACLLLLLHCLLRLGGGGLGLLLWLRFSRLIVTASQEKQGEGHKEAGEEHGDSAHGSQPIRTAPSDHSADC